MARDKPWRKPEVSLLCRLVFRRQAESEPHARIFLGRKVKDWGRARVISDLDCDWYWCDQDKGIVFVCPTALARILHSKLWGLDKRLYILHWILMNNKLSSFLLKNCLNTIALKLMRMAPINNTYMEAKLANLGEHTTDTLLKIIVRPAALK